jgi:alpha-tubulin suppressor-like RCC1 family protein
VDQCGGPNGIPAVDLGTGNTATAIAVAPDHTCALLQDGSVKCWGGNMMGQLGLGDTVNRGDQPNQMGDNLPAVDLGTGKTAIAIRAHLYKNCALLSDKNIKCWGMNDEGELGVGDIYHRGDEPNEMGDNLPAIDLGAAMPVLSIVSGGNHTCAVLSHGGMKCWGSSGSGQLGQGDIADRGDNPGEMGDSLPFVTP